MSRARDNQAKRLAQKAINAMEGLPKFHQQRVGEVIKGYQEMLEDNEKTVPEEEIRRVKQLMLEMIETASAINKDAGDAIRRHLAEQGLVEEPRQG